MKTEIHPMPMVDTLLVVLFISSFEVAQTVPYRHIVMVKNWL